MLDGLTWMRDGGARFALGGQWPRNLADTSMHAPTEAAVAGPFCSPSRVDASDKHVPASWLDPPDIAAIQSDVPEALDFDRELSTVGEWRGCSCTPGSAPANRLHGGSGGTPVPPPVDE